MTTPNLDIAVVVISCDNYSDLWAPFLAQFRKCWPECPYPVYLTSNHKVIAFESVRNIAVGDDLSWSDNLKTALKVIPEEYVLMFIEDLILVEPVRVEALAKVLAWTAEHRPNHVRLNRSEAATHRCNDLVGEVAPGAPYRTSTVLSLWRKETLEQILKSGENAWQFEILGSQRSDAYPEFYTVHDNCFPVLNGVIKGKWTRQAVKQLTKHGITLDLQSRSVMNWPETIRNHALSLRAQIFKLIPWKARRIIRIMLMGKK